MSKLRAGLGIAAGAILLLSSAAHGLLGWPGLRTQLTAAGVPGDLLFGLMIGWYFGSVSMIVFGVIVLHLFARRFRGERLPAFAAVVIGTAYLAFGGWALAASGNMFFFIFIVPALLMIAASEPAARGTA
jgi:dolichyl-phosphate-mannose--protein O-mannosyl transferase